MSLLNVQDFPTDPTIPAMWFPYTLMVNLVAPLDGKAHIAGELSIPSGLLVDLSATTGHTLLEVI